MREIAERIKEARCKRGMTQQELAEAIGLKDRSSITKIEHDVYEISLERIKQIAVALNVDADYLIFGDTEDVREEINALFDKLTEAQQQSVLQFLRTMLGSNEEDK